jgi:hypothetical protein
MTDIKYDPLPVVTEIVTVHPNDNELLKQLKHEPADDMTVIVSAAETARRLNFCMSCDRFGSDEHRPGVCLECNCSIPMITTLRFKTCPIGKWSNE